MHVLKSKEVEVRHEFGISIKRLTEGMGTAGKDLPIGLMRCVVPPRESSALDAHIDREIFFVASGQGHVRSGENKIPIEQGDLVLMESHEPHTVENASSEADLVFLSIYWIEPASGSPN
jgi:mannose-6-phosphate isomerase-like protein (cupin superfamily)